MAKYSVENEKFVIRPMEEKDKEQVKELIKEHAYFKRLWSVDKFKDIADSFFESIYLDSDDLYCIFSKESDKFCGYIEINPEEEDDEEGELSIRLLDNTDICDVMKIFGDIFKVLGYKEANSITIQYSLD